MTVLQRAIEPLTKQLNLIINPDFRINQRVYASAATLAAGVYGHDRWKAGASGGNYSFTQLNSSTQITIASGKTLIQVIEAYNIESSSYTLSWTGTAQARIGINTSTPSGSYASSPITISGQVANSSMSVEFNAGTLSTVKLEVGTVATPFTIPNYELELLRCLRYYQTSYDGVAAGTASTSSGVERFTSCSTAMQGTIHLYTPMRAAPTITFYNHSTGATGSWYDNDAATSRTVVMAINSIKQFTWSIAVTADAHLHIGHWTADAEL